MNPLSVRYNPRIRIPRPRAPDGPDGIRNRTQSDPLGALQRVRGLIEVLEEWHSLMPDEQCSPNENEFHRSNTRMYVSDFTFTPICLVQTVRSYLRLNEIISRIFSIVSLTILCLRKLPNSVP